MPPIPAGDRHFQDLERLAGHHARTVKRNMRLPEDALLKTHAMCPICTTPITLPYTQCKSCLSHLQSIYRDELADVVVPLTYAVKNHPGLSQFYSDMWTYKREPHPSDKALNRVASPVLAFSLYHLGCLERVSGHPVTCVTIVPSGRGHSGERLLRIASGLTSSAALIRSWNSAQPRDSRASGLNPDDIEFDQPLSGHVIVLEDTWVTGTNAQSVAIQAHRKGASYVSVVAIARLLDYSWPPAKQLIDSWSPDETWKVDVCPVTGGICPHL